VKNKANSRISSRSSAAILAWFAVLLLTAFCATQRANTYAGRLGIVRADYLSAEESEVEARFATYLETHTSEAVARYIRQYGKEISTDNARELSADYAPGGMDVTDPVTRAARTKWGEAVFHPARAFSRELFHRALRREPPAHERRQVVFTAGGAGVGKSSSIRQLPEMARAVEAAEIVYDTTLSELKSAVQRINEGVEAGRMVRIVFVYRDPVDATLKGIFPRAKDTGRIPALGGVLLTHLGAIETLLKLAAVYQNDLRVTIAVIDNSGGFERATLRDVGFVASLAGKYSRDTLKAQLVREAEVAYEKGKRGERGGLPEVLYQAFIRRFP